MPKGDATVGVCVLDAEVSTIVDSDARKRVVFVTPVTLPRVADDAFVGVDLNLVTRLAGDRRVPGATLYVPFGDVLGAAFAVAPLRDIFDLGGGNFDFFGSSGGGAEVFS